MDERFQIFAEWSLIANSWIWHVSLSKDTFSRYSGHVQLFFSISSLEGRGRVGCRLTSWSWVSSKGHHNHQPSTLTQHRAHKTRTVSWDTRVTQTTINPHTETEYWPRSAEFKAWQLLRRVSIDSCKSWAGSDHSKLSQQKFAHGSVKIWQQCETLVELCYNSGPSLILLTPPSPLTTLTDQFLTRQVGTRQRSNDPGTLLINTNFTINHKKSMYGNVRW